jgi:hypothetical protein
MTTFYPERCNSNDFPNVPGLPPSPHPLSKPIYTHPTYFTLFSLSSFIPAPEKPPHPNTFSHYSHLLASIHFVTAVVNNSPDCTPAMKRKVRMDKN